MISSENVDAKDKIVRAALSSAGARLPGGVIGRFSSPNTITTVHDNAPGADHRRRQFDNFAGFAREFSRHLDGYVWHGNLDALNDILRGGFGTPEQGFVLRWLRSDLSREGLGWNATIA